MRSAATVRVELDGAHNRFVELRSSGALQLRPTPKGLFVVGGAAGPVGGDRFELDIDIGPGAELLLTTAAANLVHPGPTGERSHYDVRVRLGDGSRLRWTPQPTIAITGADHAMTTTVDAADTASFEWIDELVLGRHDEEPGRVESRVDLVVGGTPSIRTRSTHAGLTRVRTAITLGDDAPPRRWSEPLGACFSVGERLWQEIALTPTVGRVEPDRRVVSSSTTR